jgi:hypothetical protein
MTRASHRGQHAASTGCSAPGQVRSIGRRLPDLLLILAIAFIACSANAEPVHGPLPASRARALPRTDHMIVRASWYGPGLEGRRTASGERFSSRQMTAAAKRLPLGAHVMVTNLSNGRSAMVRINDRCPIRRRAQIDLSRGVARKLGIIQGGITLVRITVVAPPPAVSEREL